MEFFLERLGLGLGAIAEHHKVIGIPDIGIVGLPVSAPTALLPRGQSRVAGHIPVEFVQVDVGQQRAHDAALRSPLRGVAEQLLFHHPSAQEFLE
jgi:hypothetical protein